jgi:NADH-quinone oxidoreductase subunit C
VFVRVPKERLLEVMRFLRDDAAAQFEQLTDVTCVDYLNFPSDNEIDPDGRFGVTYGLLSLTLNHRLWVKVFVDDPDPEVPSVWPIWHGAEWTEREVYDMYGVRFTDHPDLRRILMPANFVDYPLRKDYPLTGKGERERFPVVTRETA